MAMPTVLRIDGFRFFFYSADRSEPMHVHVERGSAVAKVWASPVRLERSRGFSNVELGVIMRHVETHQASIMRSWNEFFSE